MGSRLTISLLGPPHIECDGVPIKLDRRKAIALLAYLAVTGESHRRDMLVNLLWPEYDGPRGRSALRRTLHALSTALTGAWLDADREEIGLTGGAGLWVDVVEFRRRLAGWERHGHPASDVCAACVAPLAEAVGLVHGEFLSGFGLKDSVNFDDWQLFQAEALRRELAEALARLGEWHTRQREFEAAIGYTKRQLGLDPLDEGAHRQLMRLYAWSGRRPAALRQYQECEAVLGDQLGVMPQERTMELYRAIQAGRAPAPPEADGEQSVRLGPAGPVEAEVGPPSFLAGEKAVERPVFVARERELAQLEQFLELALAGQGRLAFVVGEAGSGKTALIQEFARRALAAHPDLVVAGGHGNAHTGLGDPYLPFREVLGLLTGDVEAQRAAGAMTQEQARRLWGLLPWAVQALVKTGPDLIHLFVPGGRLLERALAVRPWPVEAAWLAQLEGLVGHRPAAVGLPGLQQSALFEQYTQVLGWLSARQPLLLALDDLQWADGGSIQLLFHVGRQLAGRRILIVGAYRPTELALGRPASTVRVGTEPGEGDGGLEGVRERHPLEPVVNEFKRTFGAIEVDLEQVEGRRFVDALLDSEPNRLSPAFREALYQHTQGHPLFTIELLRGMQERGDLVRDDQGPWLEGPALDWETLPARVEAVVAERIRRLPQGLQELLSIASVEGETFTAEVLACVQATGEREIVRRMSDTLDRKHRLVGARGIVRVGTHRLSQYRFRHILYQKYLYGDLDGVERAHLHEQVGSALEGLYSASDAPAGVAPVAGADVAVQLARHFEEAGIAGKAIRYLHLAGERAVQLSAYQEAIAHLTRGLALLPDLPDSTPDDRLERTRHELALQLTLGQAWMAKGSPAPEVKAAFTRARQLCRQTGKALPLCRVLGELSIVHYVRAEYLEARDLAEEALGLAQQAKDPMLVAVVHWHLGFILFGLGQYTGARAHLHHIISFYDPHRHHRPLVLLRGSDAGLSALAYDACCLWCLGYPDQALRRSQEVLALARAQGHPLTLADVLCYGGCMFHQIRRDAQALEDHAEELVRLATDQGFSGWLATANCFRGEALAMLGQVEDGIAFLREGLASNQARFARCYLPGTLRALAGAHAQAGRLEEALATVADALALVGETDERHWEADLRRLRAELLLMNGEPIAAEASFQQAIAVARRQGARSWELRAANGLARLWQAQGRQEQARHLLDEIYGWFTEGLDTPDLREAQALLAALSHLQS